MPSLTCAVKKAAMTLQGALDEPGKAAKVAETQHLDAAQRAARARATVCL